MRRHRKKKISQKELVLILFVELLVLGLIVMAGVARRAEERTPIEEAGSSEHADHASEYLVYGEERYPVVRNLTTVLLLGTDNFEEEEKPLPATLADENRNTAMCDFFVLLAFDHDRKTVTPLQLNRDTMCDIPWLDERGRVGGYHFEQLSFAHSYGSGKEDSCVNTVATVRKLLFNAPIDHYFAFTMDAVPLMNDLVGGVRVRMPETIPALGDEYIAGVTVTLKGDAALRFIRYREHIGGSNFNRMRRHRVYLEAFTEAARVAVIKNQNLAVDAFKLISPFLYTDMTVNNISDLVDWLCEYEIEPVVFPSQWTQPGPLFYEVYVEEDELWSCVYQTLCEKADE